MPLLVSAHVKKRSVGKPPPVPCSFQAMPDSLESLARKRARHAERRLCELRVFCPELPDDILDRSSLRSVAFAVRRAGRRVGPYQTSLKPTPYADKTKLPRDGDAKRTADAAATAEEAR